jgi:hypothetical protein
MFVIQHTVFIRAFCDLLKNLEAQLR